MTRDVSRLERLLVVYARKWPVDRGKLRLIENLWRVALAGRGTMREAVLTHGAYRMPCDIAEMLQRQCYFFGTYFVEQHTLACWEHAARGARVVFDVGANAGIFSLVAQAVQPDAVVHAFEPTKEIAARLRAAVALNAPNQIVVHEAAVAARDGHASLMRWRGETDENEGMNYIVVGNVAGAERVATVSLDAFCARRGIDHVDLLKLDIQGQEPLALEGAAELLAGGRIGTIFMELTWARDPDPGGPASAAIERLAACGYRFSAVASSPHWQPAGPWLRAHTEIMAARPKGRHHGSR